MKPSRLMERIGWNCFSAQASTKMCTGCFLKAIAESDSNALHVVVMDQAGFHMKQEDVRILANIRVLPLPM